MGLSWHPMGSMGLCVKGVFRTVSHAALCLLFFALYCFALHALGFAYCMGFAFPACPCSGEGFDNACNEVNHDKPMVF